MKKLLFILLLIPSLSWGAPSIRQMIITRTNDGSGDVFDIHAYGLNADGSPTVVLVSKGDIETSKVKAFYELFSLPRDIKRYIIYFKVDGSVETINFQLDDPFQDLKNEDMKGSANTDLSALKSYIESK